MKFVPALLLCLLPLWSLTANPFQNPGFENGVERWDVSDGMSTVTAEAARTGGKGLRIVDNDAANGSSVNSEAFPVKPGETVKFTFWARSNDAKFLGAMVVFKNEAGQWLKDESLRVTQGLHAAFPDNADGQWHQYEVTAPVPDDAATVRLWLHSWSTSQGAIDFDDFEISGLAATAGIAPQAAKPKPAAAPVTPEDLAKRTTPPLIVLKLDDLRPINGEVHGLWKKLTEYLISRGIKAGYGVNMSKMDEASPDYIQWVKGKQASGMIEFWFHGWDHASYEADGVTYNEFVHRSYEEQKKRFDDSQQLAVKEFGFPFTTFGPPGGSGKGTFDKTTAQVMQDEPHMAVWLYPQPLDAAGKELEAKGKVTILDRVWAVNLEAGVGQPSFQKFLQGYAANPDRPYFVLQGHPMAWGNAQRWGEFTKIIDFLVEQNAEFLTPTELASRLKSPSS